MKTEHILLLKETLGNGLTKKFLFFDKIDKEEIELELFLNIDDKLCISGDDSQIYDLDDLDLIDPIIYRRENEVIVIYHENVIEQENYLNKRSYDGWELVSVFQMPNSDRCKYFFKRR